MPNDPKEASKLRSRSARFTIHQGTLYKRGFFTPILKCIAREDTNYVLREVHEGVCGNHIGARALALLAHNAQRCNRAGQKVQSLLEARQNLSSPIRATDVSYKPLAFSAMGVGHIGTPAHWKGPMQIYRRSSGLFHKMGKSRALGYYHRTKGTQLHWRSIVCRFGIPRALVSDNGKQFNNPKFRDFCAELGIRNYYPSPSHPQSNGQAESPSEPLKQH